MTGAGSYAAIGRRWGLALAAFALLLHVLTPQGFMLSGDARIPGLGAPALVICTGHGPLTLGDHGKPSKGPKSNPDSPCGFAGQGVAAAPPASDGLTVSAPAPMAEAKAVRAFDLAPGRGLAAPPPPSQGPPTT